jgi:predicted phage terminase large subunit-like protein
MDVALGNVTRLIIDLPPRNGKSELISKYFPAWYLGKFPDNRIILASYESDFAAGWGRKARDLIEEFGPGFFNINVRGTSSAAHRWDLEGYNGGMITAGAGGAISGKGSNIFIIDDPIKNQDEAYSKLQRERIWEWYRSVVYTRLDTDTSAIILMMTRWHADDLAGRLIKEMEKGGDQWTVVSLPAIAEEYDLLGRKPGEPLWPERFPADHLMRIKAAVGPEWWAALYQQRPVLQQGMLFKRQYFRYFDRDGDIYKLTASDGRVKNVKARDCWTFQTCDPAASTRTTADYFVLGTWTVTPDNDLLLEDILRDRLEGPDQPKLFRQAYDRWHPRFQAVESAGLGKTLFQMLVREGLPVKDLQSTGQDLDKLTRARPAAVRMEAGSVYFRKNAPWMPEYEEELIAFDKGVHDDQVDVTSYAARCLVETFAEDESNPFVMGI